MDICLNLILVENNNFLILIGHVTQAICGYTYLNVCHV